MFMKLGRDEVLMTRTCLGFLSDPCCGGSKAGQEGIKETLKTKGFTWNAAILVVVSAIYSESVSRVDKNR